MVKKQHIVLVNSCGAEQSAFIPTSEYLSSKHGGVNSSHVSNRTCYIVNFAKRNFIKFPTYYVNYLLQMQHAWYNISFLKTTQTSTAASVKTTFWICLEITKKSLIQSSSKQNKLAGTLRQTSQRVPTAPREHTAPCRPGNKICLITSIYFEVIHSIYQNIFGVVLSTNA